MKCIAKTGMEMAHYMASATVVWCFDRRTFKELVKFDEINSVIDPLTHGGGAKNLASPAKEFYREYLLDQIETSVTLHHSKKVVLMNHIDCGAYGGSEKFANRNEEVKFHINELKKAESAVRERINLPVEKVFLDDEGLWLVE